MSLPENTTASLRRLSLPHRKPFRWIFRGIFVLLFGVIVGLGAYWWPTGRWQWTSDAALLARAESHPSDSAVQIALGHRLRQRGQPAAAAFAFERALKSRPSDTDTRRELARLLLLLGQEEAALLQMREIVQRDPKDAFAQKHLGEFYRSRGALSWAAEAFEQAVAAHSEDADAWFHLGETYLALHQTGRAASAIEKASRLAPTRGDYRVGLARAHLEAGEVEKAEPLLRRETEGAAGAQAAYFLGLLYARSAGDPSARQQALHWLEQARKKNPGAPGPLLALGKLMLRTGQTKQAIPLLEQANTLVGNSPEPLYVLARAYRESGRPEEARACLQRFDALSRWQQERQSLEVRLVQSPDDQALRRRLADLNAHRGEAASHPSPQVGNPTSLLEKTPQP
jgi:tetratricopeptide (TPR) repeat protein